MLTCNIKIDQKLAQNLKLNKKIKQVMQGEKLNNLGNQKVYLKVNKSKKRMKKVE